MGCGIQSRRNKKTSWGKFEMSIMCGQQFFAIIKFIFISIILFSSRCCINLSNNDISKPAKIASLDDTTGDSCLWSPMSMIWLVLCWIIGTRHSGTVNCAASSINATSNFMPASMRLLSAEPMHVVHTVLLFFKTSMIAEFSRVLKENV